MLQECFCQRPAPISTNSRKIKKKQKEEEERFTEWIDDASAVLISKVCAFIKKSKVHFKRKPEKKIEFQLNYTHHWRSWSSREW